MSSHASESLVMRTSPGFNPNLLTSSREAVALMKGYRLRDTVVLVDIHVVTETNGEFIFLSVLVHVTDPHFGYGSEPPHFPMHRDVAEPLDTGGLVGGVGLGGGAGDHDTYSQPLR